MRERESEREGRSGKEKEERKYYHHHHHHLFLLHGGAAILEPWPHVIIEVIEIIFMQTMLLLTWGNNPSECPLLSEVEYP
jgi:hypothetical protein